MRLDLPVSVQHVPVSIHASVKDATEIDMFINIVNFGFNPRICKRCDQGIAPLVGLTTYVSIHASVKDATLRFPHILSALMFQSTHL